MLNENEFNKAVELLNQNIKTKSGEEPISFETAFLMSKLDDKEQENYRKLGSLGVFHMDQLYNLAKCKSDELYNFIANANNIEDIKVNVRFGEFSSVAIKCSGGKQRRSHAPGPPGLPDGRHLCRCAHLLEPRGRRARHRRETPGPGR